MFSKLYMWFFCMLDWKLLFFRRSFRRLVLGVECVMLVEKFVVV